MGKKKFIDKKRSVTYSLIFRSTEDADDTPERTLMEASRGAGTISGPDVDAATDKHQVDTTNRRYPPGHPLAWLEEEHLKGDISNERRKELIELGFPDDGYDYLKHVRTLGIGAGSLEGLATAESPSGGAETSVEPPVLVLGGKSLQSVKETGAVGGPSVFVKATNLAQPGEDVAVFDAAKLTVLQPTDVEDEASGMIGGITAFSRRKDAEALGAERREIEELEAMMAALEADDDLDDLAQEGEDYTEEESAKDGVKVKGRVLGEGDLLDDFIFTATQGAGGAEDDAAGPDGAFKVGEEGDDWSSVEDEEESWNGSDEDGEWAGVKGANGKAAPRPGSIASTYWREERHDRKNLLEVIDERFEHLALEYDEDEIGSMEDAAEGGEIQGFADVSEFDNLLNEFLEERKNAGLTGISESDEEDEEEKEGDAIEGEAEKKKKVKKGRRRGESILKARLEAAGFDDADAEVAIHAARAALRRMEQEDAEGRGDEGEDLEIVHREVDPTAGWDCETILTLRSNLYNHPGTITEPGRARAPPLGMIRLNKAGIPVGVVLPRKAGAVDGGDDNDEDMDIDSHAGRAKNSTVVAERKKGETAEEKRSRKNAVKEAKREARVAKKDLKMLYKDESAKAHRRAATAQVQPSVHL